MLSVLCYHCDDSSDVRRKNNEELRLFLKWRLVYGKGGKIKYPTNASLPTMGPDALGKFVFTLRKNLSSIPWDKCARWFLDLPNFVKAYQTSKTPSSCLGAGQIFVRREISQICQFTRHDLKEHVNQENLISIFGRSISARSPCDWYNQYFWLTNILRWFSAPTLDKLKIWQRQILSRFLEGPNKFCQSSASGPYIINVRTLKSHDFDMDAL